MSKRLHFECDFDDLGPKRITYQMSGPPTETACTTVEDGTPVLYLNKGSCKLLAEIFAKLALGSYADGFHLHLKKNFDPDELVKLLIARGSDVNAQDNQGFSALHFAAQDFRVTAAMAILQAGAQVDLRDKYGNAPLFVPCSTHVGRGEIIKLLLEHGADRNAKNNSGKSPLDLANTIGNYDVKQFFS